ncbi:MAG: hypothetical protein QNJ12_03820 [Ilumatobacter sp.]|uniref:hypothetical protein n=1 Tax=Ilumatobacter sp. TaxID=1967498 RepID=UPI00262FCAB1|nr:hypothetical protein [Ilumatobacter sp.]MDJ0767890.1 hypothetical protein [Ilumatobacter sp.]
MTTIDELARTASRAAFADAAEAFDVDAGLRRVLADAATEPERAEPRPTLWRPQTFAVIGAVAAAVLVIVVLAVLTGDGDEQLPADTLPTVPPTTTLAPLEPATSWWEPTVAETIDMTFESGPDPADFRIAVSPDGRWAAYRDTARRACVVELVAGATPTCHELEGFGWRQLTWSSDSSRFTGGDEIQFAQETTHWVVGVDGSTTPLDDAGLLLAPRFVPGADRLAALAPTDGDPPLSYATVDASTGEVDPLTPILPGVANPSSLLPLDPDRALVIQAAPPDASAVFWLLDLTDGDLTQLRLETDLASGVAHSVSDDGDTVLVASAVPIGPGQVRFEYELWELDTGRVVAFDPAGEGSTNLAAAVSPDGSSVAAVWSRPIDGAGVAIELGVARVADLANDTPRWGVTELTSDAALTLQRFDGPQPMCWCRDGIVVVSHQEAILVRLDETTVPPA